MCCVFQDVGDDVSSQLPIHCSYKQRLTLPSLPIAALPFIHSKKKDSCFFLLLLFTLICPMCIKFAKPSFFVIWL